MTNDMLQLDVFNSFFEEHVKDKEFFEFCRTLDTLSAITDPTLYLEVVVDAPHGFKQGVSKVVKNTKDTTKDVVNVYGKAVDANAGLIKGTWDLVMKCIDLAIKAIRFIIGMISKIPNGILALIKKIEQIPSDIRNKIKGNIKLYITVDDLELLYNQSLMKRLDAFITTLTLLSQGDLWGTFFNKIQLPSDGKGFRINTNDMKLCRSLTGIYHELQNLQFQQTVIEMKDSNVVNTYFGAQKSISFVDLHGNKHENTYYEALIQLMEDIEAKKKDLEQVQKDFGTKYSRTQMNQQFAKLGALAQNRITETMQQVSKVIAIIGNIVRYVMTDIKTIENTTDKLLKKDGMNPNSPISTSRPNPKSK